jgi:hypothetical protein
LFKRFARKVVKKQHMAEMQHTSGTFRQCCVTGSGIDVLN